MPIFECLAAGWVDDDVGLLDKVEEGGDVPRLCAVLPAFVRIWTGSGSLVISRFQHWVVTVGFNDGRCWCWGRPPYTLDWGDGHRFGW